MDKLAPEKQAEIKKMSTERLVAYLIRAGQEVETVLAMDRKQLLEAWAELVATGRYKPAKPTAVAPSDPRAMADPDLQKRMYELEMMRYQEERRTREEEREERRRRDEFERQKLEMEWKMKEEEKEEKRRREEEEKRAKEGERELRIRELQLKEEELARQARRDQEFGERQHSLVSRTKLSGEAMKSVFWKFPQDPAEIPGYFVCLVRS